MKNFFHTTFSSLKVRNYRIYIIGQVFSFCGTWIQMIAQDWLVLKLTNSGTMLGLVSAFQFTPMLLLMPWGGLIADRFPKLRILTITQIISMILAMLLGIVVLTGTVQVWMVFVFAAALGLTNSMDNPTRQAFVYEMVGKDEVQNAVSLWGILISFTRIIGPAIAGVLIATIGIGDCFIINAFSYIPVLIAFSMIRKDELHASAPLLREKGQLRAGWKYVTSTPTLYIPLIMLALIGTFTYEWQASLPLFAKFVLHGDAGTYASISSAIGIGMCIGGFATTRKKNVDKKWLTYSAFALGAAMIAAAFVQTLVFAMIAFVVVGIFLILCANLTNTTLQVHTEPAMRGRVMAFWNMAFQGSTAVGGPLIGWIGESHGAPWAVAVGGIAALIAGTYGYLMRNK